MKRIVLCIIGICSFAFLSAQNLVEEDSLRVPATSNFSKRLDRFSSSRLYQMTYIGVPLVVGGLIVKSEDDHFRGLRDTYLPQIDRHLDDYLQNTPAAVMLGMKVAGVQSRSSWDRMLVSDAFSILLMGGVVNSLKQTTHVERPDTGIRVRGLVSGHTVSLLLPD